MVEKDGRDTPRTCLFSTTPHRVKGETQGERERERERGWEGRERLEGSVIVAGKVSAQKVSPVLGAESEHHPWPTSLRFERLADPVSFFSSRSRRT